MPKTRRRPDATALCHRQSIRVPHADLPVQVLRLHDPPFFARRALRVGAGGNVVEGNPGAR